MEKDHKILKVILIIIIILLVIFIIFITTKLIINTTKKPTESTTIKEQTNTNKTIEIMQQNNALKNEYLNYYQEIDYQNIDNFPNVINTLLDKNYKPNEINYILTNYQDNISILLNMEYINIFDYKDIINFDINNLNRYQEYQSKNNYDIKTVITYVNIGLDQEGYSNYENYSNERAQNDLTILVNKYHKLPDNYEPDDLVSLSYNPIYKLRIDAAEAFEKLTSAALIDNVIFYPFSAYRSFETQNVLYNRYKARDGEKEADTYSARPGFSEHQLGLAVDVRSNTLTSNLTTNDYNWMLNNSYKYGFIVRYPKGKQFITQFIEEPWHIRYLGIELATKVHDSNLTYDEYYDLYLKKSNSN